MSPTNNYSEMDEEIKRIVDKWYASCNGVIK